jgi:hypothetical protein
MSDALICIFIVSVMVMIVYGAVYEHAGMHQHIREHIDIMERNNNDSFRVKERCDPECGEEEDLS